MPRIFVAASGFVLLAALAAAQWEDVGRHSSCLHCGMDRAKFSQSRMLLQYDDGSEVALCSLHCAAVDLATRIDKSPGPMWVADYGSGKLVDAERATWVIVGGKPGIMTGRAKWAFAEKIDAEKFAAQEGGQVAGFEDAIRAAYDDMYQDTRAIRERRRARRQQAEPAHH